MATTLSVDVVGNDRLSKTLEKLSTAVDRVVDKLDKLDGKVARIEVKANTTRANRDLDATERKRKDLHGKEATVKVNAKVDKSFAEATVVADRFLSALGRFTMPAGVIAAVPTLTAVTGAAVQMTGVLGLIPAAGFAVGTAMGAAKIGTAGFGDAVKALNKGDMAKFNEELAKMAPNAQGVLREYAALQPAFQQTKLDVQTALWDGMGQKVKVLAGQFLPMVREALVSTAGSLNNTADGIFNYIQHSNAIESVRVIFANTKDTMRELEPVGAAIVSILVNIATVGSEFLPDLAGGFADAAGRAADFVAAARESGKLHEWISRGLSVLGNLLLTMQAVGEIMRNVWRASGTDADVFMEKVRQVTQLVEQWTASVQGQAAIAEFFARVRDVVSALLPLLGAVGLALYQAFTMVAPVLPSVVEALTAVFEASGPLIDPLAQLAMSIIPALAAAVQFLAPVLGPVVAAFAVARTATALWTVALAVGSGIVRLHAAAVWIGQAAMLAYQLVTSAGTAKLVAWAAAQWLMNAAMSANPIGLVVIAIAALVAGLVLAWKHSETFRAIVIGAWEGVKAAVGAVASWFTDTVFPAVVGAVQEVGQFFTWLWHEAIVPAGEGIKAVLDGIAFAAKLMFVIVATVVITPLMLLWNELAGLFMWGYENLIKPAWEGVTGAISAAWAIIEPIFAFIVEWLSDKLTEGTNHFRDACQQAWEAIRSAINTAWQWILNNVWQPILDFLNKWFIPGFQIMGAAVIAVWNALMTMLQGWWSTISALWNGIISFLSGIFAPAFNTMRDLVMAAWNSLRDGISAVWNWVKANIFDPIVNFVTVTIPQAFDRGVAAVRTAWEAIKRALRDPIQAAIDVVYNNGVVWVFNKVAETVGLGTRLSTYSLPQFATGGPIFGGIPGKDSVPILAQQGEYVFSKPAVDAAGGTGAVEALHRALAGGALRYGSVGGASLFDEATVLGGLPAFQTGGSVAGASSSGSATAGTATGSVQATTQLGSFFSDVWNKATGFVSDLAGRIGNSPWAQATIGLGRKVIDMVVEWGKKKIAEWFTTLGGGLGGGTVAGNVGAMMSVLRAVFPGLALISGFRPGAITATGNASYHGMGRAVDVPPRMDVFNWIRSNFGARTKELIFSPAGGAQIWNGRPHMYTGITRANHWDHVHWAMANGGIVNRPTFGLMGEAGPEAVIPLSRPDRAQRVMADAGLTGGGGDLHVHVTTGPQATAEQMIRSAMHRARLQRMSGRYARGVR